MGNLKFMNTQRDKIVLVGGCFDVIHYGHVSFLKQARSHGSELVVALESDGNVTRRKGPKRPIHTQKQRQEMLLSLTVVDRIIPLPTMENEQDYAEMVRKIQPSVIAVTQGDPYHDSKKKMAEHIGATIVTIPKVHTPSTSQLAKLLELE
jgi:FAD synthetase